jgi:hypothetical protein
MDSSRSVDLLKDPSPATVSTMSTFKANTAADTVNEDHPGDPRHNVRCSAKKSSHASPRFFPVCILAPPAASLRTIYSSVAGTYRRRPRCRPRPTFVSAGGQYRCRVTAAGGRSRSSTCQPPIFRSPRNGVTSAFGGAATARLEPFGREVCRPCVSRR